LGEIRRKINSGAKDQGTRNVIAAFLAADITVYFSRFAMPMYIERRFLDEL